MELIDIAHAKIISFVEQLTGSQIIINTEQDTRLKVINPIIMDILGWTPNEIFTEEYSNPGFVDYKLTVSGFSRLIVEAKKDSRDLGILPTYAGKAYKLNGAVFNTEAAKEGIKQAIAYCGQKNAELACVTNGREWIIFRGSRLGDGKDTLDGMGFVFSTLDDVIANFKLFYNLLSYQEVERFTYRAYFQDVEGKVIRPHNIRKSLRHPNSRKLLRTDNLSVDLDRIMTSFFRRLSGDDDVDLLSKCFVVTRESENADSRIARISEDLAHKIRDIDTESGDQLKELIDRVKTTQRNEFVLLIGTKGAGKTTFIDRFFRQILPKSILNQCVIARINLSDSEGNELKITEWLNSKLLESLEKSLFNQKAPTFDEILGMFFDEYQRRSEGSLKHLYEKDKEEFKIDFGKHVENIREQKPHEYLKRLIRHIAKGRKRLPCLIFDNADHFTIEFQEKIFQYARSIYESELCLIIMPITDRTSWQLSREGALRSFENESLYLPTPEPKVILQKRITYFEEKLKEEKKESGKGYFFARGITLSIENLTAFSILLQNIFLKTGDTSFWIGNLANRDIRRCLELAKNVIISPHIEVKELLKAYVSNSSIEIPPHKIRKALIRAGYDIYPTGVNNFVHNIFALDEEIETSPLLGIRILKLLRDIQDGEDKSVTINQIVEYFGAMSINQITVHSWLEKMLEKGLCFNYDPTVTTVYKATSLELSPSGFQHLIWGLRESNYLMAMMEVTPLMDLGIFEQLSNLAKQPRANVWKAELEAFINYLISEDAKFCLIPEHEAYLSQKKIPIEIKQVISVI
jgi:energy-coupling factor transporter ATP-binding protein EcfA2